MHTDALDEPGMGFALPTSQLRHDELLDAPVSGLYVPAGHCANVWRTLAAPTAPQYPPVGQSAHCVCWMMSVNFPAGQAMHEVADRAWEGLYVPGMHGRQLPKLVPITVGLKCVPAGQAVGVTVPSTQ